MSLAPPRQQQQRQRQRHRPADTPPARLCAEHATPTSALPTDLHLLTRDILHALLVPIVELFDKATAIALAATHASRLEQLEHCYTGAARSAFLWLQCFLASERERAWCHARGCPACAGAHALDSEFRARLLAAACLLSDVHYPFTLEGPTLPSFRFFLAALERALARDALYGADFVERMRPKALATRNGIEELIYQCIELDTLLSQPSSPSTATSPAVSLPPSPVLGAAGGKGMKVKRSKLAKRQMRLEAEEEAWMEQMLRRCWDQLQPEEAKGRVVVPVEARSLDAVLKAGAVVAERELESDDG